MKKMLAVSWISVPLCTSVILCSFGDRSVSAADVSSGERSGTEKNPSETKLPWETYSGYFVSNQFEPQAAASFAVVTDREEFGKIFGVAAVMRDKSRRLSPDAFRSKIVLAAIHRGSAIWEYRVEGVTVDRGVVRLRYATTAKKSDSATFACPLIVSVPKGDYASAVFVEDGKPVKTIRIGKGP